MSSAEQNQMLVNNQHVQPRVSRMALNDQATSIIIITIIIILCEFCQTGSCIQHQFSIQKAMRALRGRRRQQIKDGLIRTHDQK